jgi:hypothetical protein
MNITMCLGNNCPLKLRCYRFNAKAVIFQPYFMQIPYDKNKNECSQFYEFDIQKGEPKEEIPPIEIPRKYWYVIGRNNGKLPTFKHESLESAEAEAKRLVEVGRVESAEIVQCVGVVLAIKDVKTYKLV